MCGAEATDEQLAACLPNVEAQLAYSKAKVVLLVGVEAGEQACPGITRRSEFGIGWIDKAKDRIYYLVLEPDHVLHVPERRPQWDVDIKFLGRLLQHQFVQRAKAIFKTDSTWPALIDPLTANLSSEIAESVRLQFASTVIGETNSAPEAVRRGMMDDLFGEFARPMVDEKPVKEKPEGKTTKTAAKK